jgi:hypothetical protein
VGSDGSIIDTVDLISHQRHCISAATTTAPQAFFSHFLTSSANLTFAESKPNNSLPVGIFA